MKVFTLIFCGICTLFVAAPASAEELSHDDMVCALNPDCAAPFADKRLRGLTAGTPQQQQRPPLSFDVTVNFPFDSAELTADARAKLDRVAKALTDPTTVNFDIIISGHTDAKGSAEYNQQLSQRRAEAVRRYFIDHHGIVAGRLVAKGYGKSQPLLPSDPYNDLNRRVQFLNPNTKAAAVPAEPSKPAPAATKTAPTAAKPSPMTPNANGDGL
jgi:outer membrane protein OmpA-like peptidoglycan-associated protein